jgi:hypothetical protein
VQAAQDACLSQVLGQQPAAGLEMGDHAQETTPARGSADEPAHG